MVMGNTNFQTIYPMGGIVNGMVKQATGREPVDNLDMDYVTVAQNTVVGELEFTGDVVQFNTGRSVPIRKLEVSLEPVQSGSGDPSPENIRPISGHTGVVISNSPSKNLFYQDTLLQATGWQYSEAIPTFQGVPVYAGTLSNLRSSFSDGLPVNFRFKENTRYNVSWWWRRVNPSTANGLKVHFEYTDGTSETSSNNSNNTEDFKRYGASSASGKTIDKITFEYNSSTGVYIAGFAIQEYPNIVTDVPLPSSTIISDVTFPTPPGTVYGGTLDVVSGKLLLTWMGVEMSSLPWQAVSTYFRTTTTLSKKPGIVNVLCSYYRTSTASSATVMPDQAVKGNADNSYIYAKDTSFASVEDFLTAVAGQKLVYELAVPVEYQLTPQEVSTLVGDNTIYSDAGAVDVMYWVYREMN